MAETSKETGKEITVVPLEPGAVTTLNGTTVTAIPLGGQPATGTTPPYGLNTWSGPSNWSNPPVVMIPPQQPLILVVADNKKEDGAKDKQHSRVFTRL